MTAASVLTSVTTELNEELQNLSDLQEELERLHTRAKEIRNRQGKTPMKYALECLPELIGETDFRDLCEVICGVDIGTGEEARRKTPTGPEFAEMVRSMIVNQHVRRHVRLAQMSERGLPL